MFKNYLKTMLRSLLKNKAYSFLNVAGLAIGIACASLIFLWVGDELTFDNVNLKKNNLYQVKVNSSYAGNNFTMGSTPRLLASSPVAVDFLMEEKISENKAQCHF